MNISDLDKNLVIPGLPDGAEYELHNICEPVFDIRGVMLTDGGIVRMPKEAAERVSVGVGTLYRHTAGGRIRFSTDSPYVIVVATCQRLGYMAHMTHVGSSGFDVYRDGVIFEGSLIAAWEPDADGYRYSAYRPLSGEGDITVDMPLYNELDTVYIGLARGSRLSPPTSGFAVEKPVVYYGSSVTQGGCASRPGTSYQGFLSRELNIDYINLGFSGNAKGEREMAEYIATLDMSAFVFDYDYNAPSAAELERTHGPFFNVIRAARPDLPIIMMSRPVHNVKKGDARVAVILNTYNTARACGDKNVYFVSSDELTRLSGSEGTVDQVHPTDLGFMSMAKAVEPILRIALGLTEEKNG